MSSNELTDELKEQARKCKTEEELVALAEKNNMELNLDELDAAAGGRCPQNCKNLAARCTRFDKAFFQRCQMYTQRWWD